MIHAGYFSAVTTVGRHHRILESELHAFIDDATHRTSLWMRPLRIMLIDDTVDYGQLFLDYFEENELTNVKFASSGFSAGFAVSTFDPDVVLLDIQMPGLSGIEVRQMLSSREEHRNVPILAVSGIDMNRERVDWANLGFNGFVDKLVPFSGWLAYLRPWVPTGPWNKLGLYSD